MMAKKTYLIAAVMTVVVLDGSVTIVARSRQDKRNVSWFWKKNKPAEASGQNEKPEVPRDTKKDIHQGFKTYSEVVSLIEDKAFRSVDFSKFIQNSLKAAVAEVDAHSAFLDPESYKAAIESTSSEFSGIGVSIISKMPYDEALVVIDVIPGGPAEKAGLRGGDKIVEVDGKKLRGLSTDESLSKLKGKTGTTVKIKVIRRRKPLEFKITRDVIKNQASVCFFFADQQVYYLSLRIFSENAASQVSELLQLANQGKCKGVIIDLRRNPGGILNSAIEMAGLFLDKNSVVAVTKDREKHVVDTYATTTEPILKTDMPIFILVDNFTASAAEILAGSLRHHSIKSYEKNGKKAGRNLLVFLVGTSTFGKGSVQEVIPISNGCALKLTTMLYYLPDDLSIQATGIEPDFLVKPKFFSADRDRWVIEMYGKESSLKGHVTVKEATGKEGPAGDGKEKKLPEELDDELADIVDFEDEQDDVASRGDDVGQDAKSEETPAKWEEKQKELLGTDVQVQAAVNMISLLDLGRRYDPSLANRQKALEFLKNHYVADEKRTIQKIDMEKSK
ncbi:MAG: S41 family peptidase [Candidatus Babeliales bacterium]|jgi:carboxyl-terminal processing protease